MSKLRLLLPAIALATMSFATGALPVSAHNAAHIYIDGRCLQVGSGEDYVFVFWDRAS